MKIIRPLTLKQVRGLLDENHRIKVVVALDLDDLINNDWEGFHDLIDDRIIEDCHSILEEIAYKVVGHIPGTGCNSGEILIEVEAGVDCGEDDENVRLVEYYRCWGSGTWDTHFINIPVNTPDDQLDQAVREACQKVGWRDVAPKLVGYYAEESKEKRKVMPWQS